MGESEFPPRADVAIAISGHLAQLDQARPYSHLRLAAPGGKEKYETYLSYSRRKFDAAAYHLANVQRSISQAEADAQQLASTVARGLQPEAIPGGTITRLSASTTETADHYAYELSAFLGAVKSSLDMLAEAASLCIPGLNTNFSISPLMKFSGHHSDHPTAEIIAKHAHWLTGIRDYRHHLVHRLMPSFSAGSRAVGRQNRTSATRIPVVVPESTPKYVPDTREIRLRAQSHDQPPAGLLLEEGSATVRHPDGSEETLFIHVSALPAPGFLPIEAFMARHLQSYATFLSELLPTLAAVAFEP